ncbi:MAG TPA: vWA domain-containing protein [Vicinamibacteria bacterium]|nr:vWA domain-containing protein [Vicinamibacteria bacterium]
MLPALLALALQAGPALPGEGAPSPPPPGEGPVILFLVDNSASLPPLDPDEKRVTALEKMFTFLRGHRYRLILFGGKDEIFVDDVTRYRNDGQWTDFYHAFLRAQALAASYPPGVALRMVLLTDAIPDPNPKDWPDVPAGWEPRSLSVRKTVDLLAGMRIPLYVVLIGNPPGEVAGRDREQSPGFVLDMVRAANGAAATPLAQTVASFFQDDGLLLRKFVYRVAPHEGLKKIEPVVKRIASPPRAGIEMRIFLWFVLPLLLILVALLGLLVRSFPGPGDLEILELKVSQPTHVAADRIHRAPDGTWSTQGLSLVADARTAAATFTLHGGSVDLAGAGLDTAGLDPRDAALLPLGIDEVRRAIEAATDHGTREDKIHALNLDYAARSLKAREAERILSRSPAERSRLAAVDFVRAKAHLAFDEALRRRLLEPRAQIVTYGRDGTRLEVAAGDALRVGRYGFLVREITRGGRRDGRLVLYYDRVPSLLGLKTILPDLFQRAFRFRRSRQRIVS